MRQTSEILRRSTDQVVKDIRRATRKQHSPEDKIRIVLEGLCGECNDPVDFCSRAALVTITPKQKSTGSSHSACKQKREVYVSRHLNYDGK